MPKNLKWTNEDDALLYALQQRKTEFESRMKANVRMVATRMEVARSFPADVVVDDLFNHAEALVDVLMPIVDARRDPERPA